MLGLFNTLMAISFSGPFLPSSLLSLLLALLSVPHTAVIKTFAYKCFGQSRIVSLVLGSFRVQENKAKPFEPVFQGATDR